VLILVAGATPVMGPLQDQTWESFSVHWQVDVTITFTWLRAALLQPGVPRRLRPGGVAPGSGWT
jgi:3-oxoacyl-[acyl-carrier protein] reductase